jgi:hypothetical protein
MDISYGKPTTIQHHPGTYCEDGSAYQFTVLVEVNDWGNIEIIDIKWKDIEPLDVDLVEDEIKDKFFDTQRG